MEEDKMYRFAKLVFAAGLTLCLLNCPSTPKPPQQAVEIPVFTPEGGTFSEAVSVEIKTATEGAEIRYTLDGSTPSPTNGTLYTGAVTVDKTTTMAAIATKKDLPDSEVAKATYTISKETAVAPPVSPPITDQEVTAVRDAIARAKEADADYYDPDTISEARKLLDDALTAREADPAKARELLSSAKEKADLAYRNAVEKTIVDLSDRMEAMKEMLLQQEADKFLPDEYQAVVAGIDDSKSMFADDRFAEGRTRAYETLKAMADLSALLEKRLAWIKILKKDTEQFLRDAEAADANQWAPEAKTKANALYLQGMEAFQAYKLDEAEESYGAAREAAKDAARLAQENKSASTAELKKKTEELKLQAMKALEDASALTVVTEDGTIIEPQKWSGDDALKQIEEMEKQRQERQKENQDQGSQSMTIPGGSATVVLADESMEDLLTQAKELWKLGLQEEANQNYLKAQEYYQEAMRYVEVYKSFAVKGVYTVRLILDRRDCLWRISEYDYVYGDPRLWPKIWRRNRKLIQNPDLIYPGWDLVIPPQ
jgi:nucleoid-associated protein YgaU